LADIKRFLTENRSKQDIRDLFHPEYFGKYGELLKVVNPNEEVTQSCMVFLNHSTPYYFLGCRSGAIYGLPVFNDLRKNRTAIMIDNSVEANSEVKFITTRKNCMFVAYRSGLFRMYSL
jgi:hypothetical protein